MGKVFRLLLVERETLTRIRSNSSLTILWKELLTQPYFFLRYNFPSTVHALLRYNHYECLTTIIWSSDACFKRVCDSSLERARWYLHKVSNKENQNTSTKQLVKVSRQRLASEDQLFLTSPFREVVANDSQEIVNLFTRTSITDETIANYSKLKNN